MIKVQSNPKLPCWILTYARTGSTYLCALLNAACGNKPPVYFEEWYQIKRYEPSMKMPFYNKFLAAQAEDHKLYPDAIEKTLPGCFFINLYRKDYIASAISFMFSSQTHIWRIESKEQLNTYLSRPVHYDPNLLKSAYERSKKLSGYWQRKLNNKNSIIIEYEQIKSNPVPIIEDILNKTNTKWAIDKNKLISSIAMLKQTRPETSEYTEKFKKQLKY